MSALPSGLGALVGERIREAGAVTDPVGWSHDRLGVYLWSKQREILESIRDHRHTAVQSANSVGKSFTAATAACWWLASHPVGEAFVVTTATTSAQVEGILWREIERLRRAGGLPGWTTGGPAPTWKIEGQLVGVGRKPADDDLEGLLGYHARYMLVVIDEASGVPLGLFKAAESLATSDDSRILAIGNPLVPDSPFAKACAPGSGWNRLKISAFDLPVFTGEEVPDELAARLAGATWVAERAQRWGENSPAYVARVLGEFPEIDDRVLIHPSWIVAAQERALDPELHAAVLGVDVGGGGGAKSDRTAIYRARGGWLRRELVVRGHDTMQTAGEVARLLRGHNTAALIDKIGVGQGVFDALREQGAAVYPFRGSERPRDPVQFANRRAESYWQLADAFKRGEVDLDPLDEDLAAELGALRWKLAGRHGQILIESKEEMRKRGLPSPDLADAACIAFTGGGGLAGIERDLYLAGLSDAERWLLANPPPVEPPGGEWDRGTAPAGADFTGDLLEQEF